MSAICETDFTRDELRVWCKKLGLPCHGTKAELVVRLNDVNKKDRGRCPELDEDVNVQSDEASYSGQSHVENQSPSDLENSNSNGANNPVITKSGKNNKDELQQQCADLLSKELSSEMKQKSASETKVGMEHTKEIGKEVTCQGEDATNTNEIANESKQKSEQRKMQDSEMTYQSEGAAITNEMANEKQTNEIKQRSEARKIQDSERMQQMKESTNERERWLMQKEIELLRFERELLRRENDMLKNNDSAIAVPTTRDEIPFNSLKEFLPDYDGETNVNLWLTHIEGAKKSYDLGENKVRALLFAKLKGRAQTWLYSKPEFASESTECILASMKKVFVTKESAIALRQKFESRKWRNGEPFSEYFNDKIVLASSIQIPEDELIDYIIHGIPDRQLRINANMQRFETKDDLMSAFANIDLQSQPRTRSSDAVNEAKPTIRCYNCNCLGHMASECRKSKRDVGACYACGDMGHRAANCRFNRKKAVEQKNSDYNAS